MKRVIVILTFLLLISSAFAVLNEYGDLNVEYNGYLHISSIKYEPYPAEPGKYFDLWLRIQNAGPDKADIKFKLTPKFPFSLDINEVAERDLYGLGAGETALIHYKVRTAINAVEGSTPLGYEAVIGGARQSANVNIWIQTIDANVAVSSVKTQVLVPGEVTPVEIELENRADSQMSNINIKLDLTASTLPFIPINSTTEKKLYFIEPGKKSSVIFDLMALPGATSNAYKVPIELRYTDGTGKSYNKTSIIGLVIGATPDLLVTIASSDIYSKGSTGDVSIKIVNKGLTDIKLMKVILKDSENYDILSESNVYVGSVDSDDYETAEFKIKVKKVKDKKAILNIELNYLDANNKEYTDTFDVELKVISAKELGVGSNNSFIKIIGLLVLIGAGFFFYRKWEKKKLAKR